MTETRPRQRRSRSPGLRPTGLLHESTVRPDLLGQTPATCEHSSGVGFPTATEGYDAVAGGLRKSYGRARNRTAETYEEPTFERFHGWRRRIEYHRYHTRLLRRVWVGPMKRRRAELEGLSDVVGYENDLAAFETVMRDEELFASETGATPSETLAAKRSELHRRGRPSGEWLFAEDPDRPVDRLGAYWTATHEYDPAP